MPEPESIKPAWIAKNEVMRKKLGLNPEDRPWTGRPDVHLHGLRRQLAIPNFQYDQIDFTYTGFRQKQNLDVLDCSRDELKHLIADIREGTGHTRSDGNVTMKTGSLLYYHKHDRTLCGQDHFLLQGWGLDVDVTTLNETFGDSLQAAYARHQGENIPDGVSAKKRKGKMQTKELHGVQKKAAGNAMVLPDVGLLQYASFLAMDNPSLWQNPPVEEEITIEGDVGCVVIDPTDAIGLNRFTLAQKLEAEAFGDEAFGEAEDAAMGGSDAESD